jgi:hypothetical protein
MDGGSRAIMEIQEVRLMGYLIPVQQLLWQLQRHPEQMEGVLPWLYAACAVTLLLLGGLVFSVSTWPSSPRACGETSCAPRWQAWP